MDRRLLLTILLILGTLIACNEPEPENQDPTISFTSPNSNSTYEPGETVIFTVDASDPEHDMKEVRFYSNDIGIGSDQNWPYSFDWETGTVDQGDYTIKAEAIDNEGAKSAAEITISIEINTPPTASYTVDPGTGNTSTIFNFDASNCSDGEDETSQLQVRWDWEDDGSWDTSFNTTKTTTYQYSQVGSYTVNMEVMDSQGITNSFKSTIGVIEDGMIGTVTDIDGNVYQTITIGTQEWMSENLKVTHYTDGTAIPTVPYYHNWTSTYSGAYAIYNHNSSNEVDTYGALYNWWAVNGDTDGDGVKDKEIAPEGWHVPTDAEWKELELRLGMSQSEADTTGWRGSIAGSKLKEAGTTHWKSPNAGASNESGFTALAGGYRSYYMVDFDNMREFGYFWSASEYSGGSAWCRVLKYALSGVYREELNKKNGFSARLLKD